MCNSWQALALFCRAQLSALFFVSLIFCTHQCVECVSWRSVSAVQQLLLLSYKLWVRGLFHQRQIAWIFLSALGLASHLQGEPNLPCWLADIMQCHNNWILIFPVSAFLWLRSGYATFCLAIFYEELWESDHALMCTLKSGSLLPPHYLFLLVAVFLLSIQFACQIIHPSSTGSRVPDSTVWPTILLIRVIFLIPGLPISMHGLSPDFVLT